jgi:hypothetical protein
MMYHKNLAVCIKTGGKVLREEGDRVTLPFGSEYSILLKNMNSVRLEMKISIDGQDVSEGHKFIMQPDSGFEIERFVKSLDRGNRFKFIERTQVVEEGRGIKAEDGLVRVEYWKEKTTPAPIYQSIVHVPYYPTHWSNHWPVYIWPTWSGSSIGTGNMSTDERHLCVTLNCNNVQSVGSDKELSGSVLRCSMASGLPVANAAGITAPGSESSQKFHSTFGFPVEDHSEVIVLQLTGRRSNSKDRVEIPVTVDLKPICSICKKVGKASSKFCSRCGASLEIF